MPFDLIGLGHILIWFVCFLELQFKPDEIAAVVKDFDEPGTLAPTGLHLGGVKYMVIQGEPGAVIRGKKVKDEFSLYPELFDLTEFLTYCCLVAAYLKMQSVA